jgi:hypothetical protein
MVRFILAFALSLAFFSGSGCSTDTCQIDADCPQGRICRLGLCALNPNGGFDIGTSDALADIPLGCDLAGPNDLLLHEILADPGGQDVNGDGSNSSQTNEFIEVVNVSGKVIGVANAALEIKASSTKLVPLGFRCLAPFEARTVFGSEASLGLTNSGATVSLLIDGSVVDSHAYGSEANKDESITRAVQLDPTSAWVRHSELSAEPWSPGVCANSNAFPSCGGSGPVGDATTHGDSSDDAGVGPELPPTCDGSLPLEGQLVINEVMADPGEDSNGDGSVSNDDEFVELVNTVGYTLDVSGITIEEGAGKTFTFPEGTCLNEYQAAVVFARSGPSSDFMGSRVFSYGGSWGLNNGGDSLHVKSSDGELLASMEYGSEGGDNQSITLEVDLDKLSPFIRHSEAANGGGKTMSPGTCQNGKAFPACGVPVEDAGANGGDPGQ